MSDALAPTILLVGGRETTFLRVKRLLELGPRDRQVAWALFCELGRIPWRNWATTAQLVLVDVGSPTVPPHDPLEVVSYLSEGGKKRNVAVLTVSYDLREARPYLEAGAFSAFAAGEPDADLKSWLYRFLVERSAIQLYGAKPAVWRGGEDVAIAEVA
jgi:hypothetical protein